jgi:hypothetical protein
MIETSPPDGTRRFRRSEEAALSLVSEMAIRLREQGVADHRLMLRKDEELICLPDATHRWKQNFAG